MELVFISILLVVAIFFLQPRLAEVIRRFYNFIELLIVKDNVNVNCSHY